MTYDIENLDRLSDSATALTKYNQNIASAVGSLNYIITAVKNNWQNTQGADLDSITSELSKSIQVLEEVIEPTLNNYVNTINTIVQSSRENQSRSVH